MLYLYWYVTGKEADCQINQLINQSINQSGNQSCYQTAYMANYIRKTVKSICHSNIGYNHTHFEVHDVINTSNNIVSIAILAIHVCKHIRLCAICYV